MPKSYLSSFLPVGSQVTYSPLVPSAMLLGLLPSVFYLAMPIT